MKNSSKTLGLPRALWRATPVAAAAAALLCASGVAQAQTAPAAAPTGDVVTITGIRRGIESAISVKKNSDSIVEAVSAEDIGKLPDSSIAESIARLPGLTAQRVAGRAANVSIRGLSGDFSTALLNGREQVSIGDNRAVEFDQYPSELLSAVVVYKTPDGALLGQGLAGTIDMQTVRPLSMGGRTIAVNLRGEKSGVGTPFKGDGSRFSFAYIDQFADRTVGMSFGVARLASKKITTRQETYDTGNTVKWDGTTVRDNNAANPGQVVTFNQGFKYFNEDVTETRTGVMGTIEYKPSKNFNTALDLYYSKFEKDLVKRGLEIQVNDTWRGDTTNPRYPGLINPVITNGRLVSGTWRNVNPLNRTIAEPRTDDIKAAGWNTKFKFAEKLTAIADLSYSSAKKKEQINELEAGVPTPQQVTIANYNQVTKFQYDTGDVNLVKLMDPESWGQNGYAKQITVDDKLKSIRLGGEYEMDGMFSKLHFGINDGTRTKIKNANEWKLVLPGGSNSIAALPAGATRLAVGGTDFSTVSFDPTSAFPSAYRLEGNFFADIFLKSWKVEEKVTTLYAKADIDTEVAGIPVRGNIGAQAVKTDQSSSAPSVDTTNQGVATTFTSGKKYNDFLPSLNLAFDFGGAGTVRVAAAQVLARAKMDDMSAGRRAEVNQQLKWTGSGGNPLLDPFRANALDLSYEKYFGTKAYVSAAVFYKQLKSYIFKFKDTQYDFANKGFVNQSGRTPINSIGEFEAPRNGKGGKLSGIELAASFPLNMVSPMLDGFGVQANFADTTSKVNPFGDADSRPLPGLSKTVSTLTAYYEKYGFSARVAQRARSNYLGEITGFGAGREYKFIKAETLTDLQFGYEFQSGPVKGLALLLQINNATNAKYQEYTDNPSNIVNTVIYGKTYLFGGSYKF
jgi:iron complex outermembrane recepter protein